MTNYPSPGRNQLRPKGFKVKQALHLTIFLALCTWLLYQIKNSHYENKTPVTLGRKGSVGWSKDRADSVLEDVNLRGNNGKKQDGGENAKGESYIKKIENVAAHERSKGGKVPERDYKESQIFEDGNSVIQMRGTATAEVMNLNKDTYKEKYSNTGHERRDEKELETLFKEAESDENDHKENDEDGVHHIFDDENGVPQDVIDGQNSSLNGAIMLNSYTKSRMVEGEEVESKEESVYTAYTEKENKGTSDDSKNDITDDAEIDLDSNGPLSINQTVEENNIGSKGSHSVSVSSHKEVEEVNDKSMLPQAE